MNAEEFKILMDDVQLAEIAKNAERESGGVLAGPINEIDNTVIGHQVFVQMAVLDLIVEISQHVSQAHNKSWQLTAEVGHAYHNEAVALQCAIDKVQTALHNLTYCAAKYNNEQKA